MGIYSYLMQAQYIVLALMSANFVHGFCACPYTHAPIYHIVGYIRGGKFELFPAFQVHKLSRIVMTSKSKVFTN